MTSTRLIRWSGLSAVLAGVLILVADFLDLYLVSLVRPEAVPTTAAYRIESVSALLGLVLWLVGLIGVYARQLENAGPLGLAGFLVSLCGIVLPAGMYWSNLFIVHSLAQVAPGSLYSLPDRDQGIILSFVVAALGGVLFGAAILKARLFPRGAAILLIIGALLSCVSILRIPLPLPDAVFSVAIIWLGLVLWAGREQEEAQHPEKAHQPSN